MAARRSMSAMNLWDDVLARVEGQGQPAQLRHLVPPHERPSAFRRATLHVRVPNAAVQGVAGQELPGRHRRRRCDELGRGEVQVVFESRGGRRAAPSRRAAADRDAQRRRRRSTRSTPSRASSSGPPTSSPTPPRARWPRSPRKSLQPALPLRRRGSRQDPPHARHRPLHPGPQPAPEPRLHLVRPLHQRDDQRHPLRPPARLPPEVPRHRRAARRRHPVHRRARTAPRKSSSTSSTRSTTPRSRS